MPLPGSAPPPDGHNSRIALDWVGTYQALMPCADCEAILTTLTLDEGGSYELKRLYVGKDTALFDTRGRYSWSEDGARITLEEDSDGVGNTFSVIFPLRSPSAG